MLLNPAAGLKHDEAMPDRLSDRFAQAGSPVRIVLLGFGTDAAQAVRSAVHTGAAAVVAAGGDGTVRSVAAGLESFATRELHVDTRARRAVRVALDGEVRFMTMPLRYRILPRALRVIVPAR